MRKALASGALLAGLARRDRVDQRGATSMGGTTR